MRLKLIQFQVIGLGLVPKVKDSYWRLPELTRRVILSPYWMAPLEKDDGSLKELRGKQKNLSYSLRKGLNMKQYFLFLAVLALLNTVCFLSPVPEGQDSEQISDDVKELESLRNEKTNVTNLENGQQEEPLPTPLASSEEPQANSRSAIFRHRGITQAKKSRYYSEKPQLVNDGYAGIQYSPQDLAVYVFNTGDEEGVAVAVEELVREGMMGRTDAINYLQDVKQILMYLRDQYEHHQKLEEFKSPAFSKQQMSQENLPDPTQIFPFPMVQYLCPNVNFSYDKRFSIGEPALRAQISCNRDGEPLARGTIFWVRHRSKRSTAIDSSIKEFSVRISQLKELSETLKFIQYPDVTSFDKMPQLDWLEIEEFEIQLIVF
ncbi:uncharacterized protein TNCV_1357341 [Trichonephila clavipes]|uniref:Uncharacterized protein n=1 Tax=Trichonephila clavipes TaxID=2585209 RepID=A0A8X6SJV3_TRICX|nr:uncharacterized protein TNCV_1357341 [Trichonephila clavipes]